MVPKQLAVLLIEFQRPGGPAAILAVTRVIPLGELIYDVKNLRGPRV